MSSSKLFPDSLVAKKRRALEDLYTGRMTVYVNQMSQKDGSIYENENFVARYVEVPCRLTRQNAPQPVKGNPKIGEEITQLTCAPELDIPKGSELVITFNGRTEKYVLSAEPRVYASHQTIMLRTWSETKRNYA